MECFTSVTIDQKYSNIHGELALFSGGGKGQFAGSIQVDYNLFTIDEDLAQMKTLWIEGSGRERKSWREAEEDGDDQESGKGVLESETLNALKENVFMPLWKLERETYGEKADRLIRYDDSSVGLRRWAGKQSRGKKRKVYGDDANNGGNGEEKKSNDVATW